MYVSGGRSTRTPRAARKRRRVRAMPKWRVYGAVSATKYIGVVEAETEAQAIEVGGNHKNAYVSLCWQCSDECDGAEIQEIVVEQCDPDEKVDPEDEDDEEMTDAAQDDD
jgi:hypothetical protein